MTHQLLQQIAGFGGMALFMLLFAIAVIYALRPSNRDMFNAAANAPLAPDPRPSDLSTSSQGD
jgi:cbb3-type cytochrome oxidase subunit 3